MSITLCRKLDSRKELYRQQNIFNGYRKTILCRIKVLTLETKK